MRIIPICIWGGRLDGFEATCMSTAQSQSVQLIYSDHHHWLRRWLLRKVGCPHRAEDLAHDSFERVLRSASHADFAEALREPRAFLVTTARRLLIDDVRRRRIEQCYLEQLASNPPDEAGGALEEWVTVVEALVAIARLLDGLPQRTRTAFLLYRFDGLQQGEIAQRLGVSPTRVKQYIAQVMVHCHAIAYGAESP